jgi:hypothetical protein
VGIFQSRSTPDRALKRNSQRWQRIGSIVAQDATHDDVRCPVIRFVGRARGRGGGGAAEKLICERERARRRKEPQVVALMQGAFGHFRAQEESRSRRTASKGLPARVVRFPIQTSMEDSFPNASRSSSDRVIINSWDGGMQFPRRFTDEQRGVQTSPRFF